MVGLVAEHEVEGVDERPVIVARAAPDALDHLGRERLQCGVVAGDAPRQRRKLTQVWQTDRPARSREQPDQRRSRARVAEHPQGADDVDDLGGGEQPAQAQDAMRDAAAPEGIAEAHHVLLAAEQNRARRREGAGTALVAHATEPLRHPIGLGVEVDIERELDLTRRCPPGGRATRGRRRIRSGQGCQHGVGCGEHARAVAPAGGEGELGAWRAERERPSEPGEVARAGAAPAVDRLMRIAHGHHGRSGEECGEKIGLHDRGVLVLVEEDDAEPVAHLVGHDGVRAHDLQRTGHLVGEVEDADAVLLRRVLTGEVGEEGERSDLLCGLGHVAVDDGALARGRPLEDVAESLGKRRQLVERDEIVDTVASDAQRRIDDAANRLAAGLEPRVVRGEHDAAHEQPRRRLRQDHRLGIAPDPHGVLAHDLVGETVVRRNRRPMKEGVVVGRLRVRCDLSGEGVHHGGTRGGRLRALPARTLQLDEDRQSACRMQSRQCHEQSTAFELREALQAALNALGELAGGLAGEGETENLVAPHEPIRDEPDDTRGHGLGLPAAGAGHHERGLERRLDHRGLLVGGRELTQGGCDRRSRQGLGGHCCRHDALTAPIVWMRHSPYECSSRQ